MRITFTLTIALVLSLSACSLTPTEPTQPLETYSDVELCNFYHHNPSESLRNNIEQNTDITEQEWQLIDKRRVVRGMRVLPMICVKGFPGRFGDVRNSVGSWGNSAQFIYRQCRQCDATYIYSRNGVVTGWQQ